MQQLFELRCRWATLRDLLPAAVPTLRLSFGSVSVHLQPAATDIPRTDGRSVRHPPPPRSIPEFASSSLPAHPSPLVLGFAMPPPPAFLPSSLLAPPCVLTWRRPSPTVRTRRTPPTPSRSARLTPRAAAGGGAVISVSDLRLQAGTRDLVYIDRWALMAGNCVGIVGANGGKRVFFLWHSSSSLCQQCVKAASPLEGADFC